MATRSRQRQVNAVELRMESGTSSTYKFYRVYTCEGSEAAITQWGRVATMGERAIVAMSTLPDRLTDKTLNGYERYGSTHVVVDAETWDHATGSRTVLADQAFQMIAAKVTEALSPETMDERKARLMRSAQAFIDALTPIAKGEWP